MTSQLLLLLRHEDAAEGDPDAHRALTALGRARMRRTGKSLAERGPPIDLILSSPLVRAVQTAEVLAYTLGFDGPIEIEPAIASPPSVRALVRVIKEADPKARGLVVVGHEPTLTAVVQHLSPEIGWTGFSKGALLALELDRSSDAAKFSFMIPPGGAS